MNPLVSIVIPTFNRERELERALKSVIAQTYPFWKAIVVDNHSNDNTQKMVARFSDKRISFFKIHNDGIIAKSRNLAIEKSTGKYVAFLDSDDWWMPDKLEESVRYLENSADVVYHDLYLVKKNTQKLFWKRVRTRKLSSPVFSDLMINGNALTNSSVVVKRSLLTAIKGLCEDPLLVSIEDFDAWLRISQFSEKFVRIPKTLGYYWLGTTNTSNPKRILSSLNAFEKRYPVQVGNLGGINGSNWINYSTGRSLFMLGQYYLASRSIRRVLRFGSPIAVMIKSSVMLFLVYIYNKNDEN